MLDTAKRFNVRNPVIDRLLTSSSFYSVDQVKSFANLLGKNGVTTLMSCESGARPAVPTFTGRLLQAASEDNLWHCWLFDAAVGIAAHWMAERHSQHIAQTSRLEEGGWKKSMLGLLRHYEEHQGRFVDVIRGVASGFEYDKNRNPHVVFDLSFRELPRAWGHIQDDAHGAFLALIMSALLKGEFSLRDPNFAKLALPYITLLFHYWYVTHVWERAGHGRWETVPAERSSSILLAAVGVLCLREYLKNNEGKVTWFTFEQDWDVNLDAVDEMLAKCTSKLKSLGVNEVVREFHCGADLAQLNGLMFIALIEEDLRGVDAPAVMGLDEDFFDAIFNNIAKTLMGEWGFVRFIGDRWDGRAERQDLDVLNGHESAEWGHGAGTALLWAARKCLKSRTLEEFDDGMRTVHYLFNKGLGYVTDDWMHPEAVIIDKITRAHVSDGNIMLAWGQSTLILSLVWYLRCVQKREQLAAQ